MNKLFSPFNFFIMLLIFGLGSVAHLMYGHCQTSKTHFMLQNFYMPENLPKWLLNKKRDNNGNIMVDNKYSGKWSSWYKNGAKEFDGEFKAGNLDGTLTKWYESGAKKSVSEWINGLENGKWFIWHENGALKSEMEYKVGNLNGKYFEWDASSNKIKDQDWKDGVMIKDYLSSPKE